MMFLNNRQLKYDIFFLIFNRQENSYWHVEHGTQISRNGQGKWFTLILFF